MAMAHLFKIFSWNAEKLLYIDVKSKNEELLSVTIFSNVSNGKQKKIIDIPINDLLDRTIYEKILNYLNSDPIKIRRSSIFNLRINMPDIAGGNLTNSIVHTKQLYSNAENASAAIRNLSKQLNTHFNGEDIVNAAQSEEVKSAEVDLSEFPDLKTELKAYAEPAPQAQEQPRRKNRNTVVI